MDQATIQYLNEINRQFYEQFAQSFANSRTPNEPGLERLIRGIIPGQHVLDLGCGMGRIALIIPDGCPYTGIDFAGNLLEIAQQRVEIAQRSASFIQADLLHENWLELVDLQVDWIFIRAVLHHIPAFDQRLNIVKRAASRLSTDGRIVIANWQFMDIPRLRKRILPWERVNLTIEDVEDRDYLLDWQRDGHGLRYVHLVNESETHALASGSGLHLNDMFYADGHTNKLTLYAVLTNP